MGRLEKIGKIAEHLRTNPWNKSGLTRLGRETDQLSLIMDIECVDKTHDLDLDAMLADLDSVIDIRGLDAQGTVMIGGDSWGLKSPCAPCSSAFDDQCCSP